MEGGRHRMGSTGEGWHAENPEGLRDDGMRALRWEVREGRNGQRQRPGMEGDGSEREGEVGLGVEGSEGPG